MEDKSYQRGVLSVRVEESLRRIAVDSKVRSISITVKQALNAQVSFADFRMLNREPGPPTFQLLDTSRLDITSYPFKFNTILSRRNLVGLQVHFQLY